MVAIDFDRIYLNQSKNNGRMRIADSGLGWKGAGANNNQPFLLPAEEILTSSWSRSARGYELRVQTKNLGVVMLDGFDQEDFNKLKQELQRNFQLKLEHQEHSLRGWNWGKTDFARNEMIFQINSKPGFEIPYNHITNANLTGKNEVAVEFNLDKEPVGDELIEMRFYVPGIIENEEIVKAENGEDKTEIEEVNAANVFYDEVKSRAEIGQVAGEAIVSFSEVLFLTPRGRYDIDMYPTSLRLRGKTYDYKIQYKQIERVFSLPKPDDSHHLIVIQIDPPLRQGQTRYPFLVMQFQKEEEIEVELNLTDEEYQEKYKDRLQKSYDSPIYLAMAHCFKGLTERRLIIPGSFQSKFLQPGISCSLKASEGYLYPLDRCFLFVTKPTVYIPFSEISNIIMARTGGGVGGSRTFDLEIVLRGGGSHIFGSIDKDEQETIETYVTSKGLRVKNEEKIAKAMLVKAMNEADDDDDADVDMGSAGDDDEESADEDFNSGSESDVAEEFDSNASASESEPEEGESDDRPPKKKVKN